MNPEVKIQVYIMDSRYGDMSMGFDQGGVDRFIADLRGGRNFEVVDVSSPPFEPSMEREVEEGGGGIPVEFLNIEEMLSCGRIEEARSKYPNMVIDMAELMGE